MVKGLEGAVERFTSRVGGALSEAAAGTSLSGTDLHENATLEAFNLCCAMIDSDGRHTDDELWALAASFSSAGLLPGATSPNDLRASNLLSDKAAWLQEPTELFTILADVDQERGSEYTKIYIHEAMAIAYMVASLDKFPSPGELNAAIGLQTMLQKEVAGRKLQPALRPSVGNNPGDSSKEDADLPETAEPEPLEDVLAELDILIGLDEVKTEVRLLAAVLRVQKLRAERGLSVVETTNHLVFSGNPGTGKTTVARLLARVYHSLGVVQRGHLVEVDRGGLVAGFVGQTATKVGEVFDRADGGVLLIDEAYSLIRGSDKDFGREAIDAIVKQVEDRRDSMTVILAGYPAEMRTLVQANPGFRSRFPKTISFADYSDDELVAILGLISDKAEYKLSPEAVEGARTWFSQQERGPGFGNGRLARNLFESAVAQHAGRLSNIADPTDAQLMALEPEDFGATAARAASTPTDSVDPDVTQTDVTQQRLTQQDVTQQDVTQRETTQPGVVP